jgi:DNA-binding MurR/RpiR family transcriptional regulator
MQVCLQGTSAVTPGPAPAPGPATGPASYDDLALRLQQGLEQLTPSHRRLAERVLADPEGVAFMTVTELAAAVGVNESTVVRFATGLGLKGYPGLTELCRERLREQAQLVRRFTSSTTLDAAAHGDLLDLSVAFDQANVVRTLTNVDREAWAATITALARAPRVHVLGLRKSHAVAYLLGYLLRMVRDDVATLGTGPGILVEELRRVRPGDCVVGIGIHRYHRDTVRGFRWARAHGATAVALTDNAASPLARDADHTFLVDTAGVAVLRSMTGFTSLVQALANAVAVELEPEARSTLAAEEDLLGEFDIYQ